MLLVGLGGLELSEAPLWDAKGHVFGSPQHQRGRDPSSLKSSGTADNADSRGVQVWSLPTGKLQVTSVWNSLAQLLPKRP